MIDCFWSELAWLGGKEPVDSVLVQCGADGRIASVTAGAPAPDGAVVLPGLTLPGLANAHSHAFQRALRGRTHAAASGSFWTWREQMYALAERLDPERSLALARATFAEMALAGITLVGEFDYIHHSDAIVQAAADAGIRLTLIDACYLNGGLDRFRDASADAWAARVTELVPTANARLAAAIHSVRAVEPAAASTVAAVAAERGWPLHAHVAEQPAEVQECLRRHDRTPLELLAHSGALSERFTAVHGTHFTAADGELLARAGAFCCLCPTTERDLADGIGGVHGRLTLGSDSNAVIDLLEEARAVELDERLRTGVRGTFGALELATAATANGYASLGWPEGGRIEPGAPADLVAVRLDGVRLAGTRPQDALDAVVFAADAGDVDTVIVGGREIVRAGEHLIVDVPVELAAAVAAVG
jgi:formiminoglutamate deiminase